MGNNNTNNSKTLWGKNRFILTNWIFGSICDFLFVIGYFPPMPVEINGGIQGTRQCGLTRLDFRVFHVFDPAIH